MSVKSRCWYQCVLYACVWLTFLVCDPHFQGTRVLVRAAVMPAWNEEESDSRIPQTVRPLMLEEWTSSLSAEKVDMTPTGELSVPFLILTLIHFHLCLLLFNFYISNYCLYDVWPTVWQSVNTPFLLLCLRFRLHFEKESKEEVEKRKKVAMENFLTQVSDKELEINIDDIYPSDKGLAVF